MKKRIYVDGLFDLFHEGHIDFLRTASSFGHLVVGVHGDKFAKENDLNPIIPEKTRYEIVRSCRYVSEVIADVGFLTETFIDKNGIDLVLYGGELSEAEIQQWYSAAINRGIFLTLEPSVSLSTKDLVKEIIQKVSINNSALIVYKLLNETPISKKPFKNSEEGFKIEYIAPSVCPDPLFSELEVDRSFMQTKYGFQICDAEITNFLNHRSAWKTFLKSPFEFALILEEGTIYSQPLAKLLEYVNNNLWDVFFPFDKTNLINKIAVQPYPLRIPWGSYAYLVTKRGVEKLLKVSTIRQPVDDEMISLALTEELNIFTKETHFFEERKFYRIEQQRAEAIQNSIKDVDHWSSENKVIIQSLLKVLSQISEEAASDLILHSGSLLGYIRHGGIMRWDDDVDLAIDENKLSHFLTTAEAHENLKFETFTWMNGSEYYKFWFDRGEPIEGHKHRFPFVDLWIYRMEDQKIIFLYGKVFENLGFQPFQNIVFENSSFKIPYDPMLWLDLEYPDWKELIRLNEWNHRLEKYDGFPLTTPITVGKDGKMEKYIVHQP